MNAVIQGLLDGAGLAQQFRQQQMQQQLFEMQQQEGAERKALREQDTRNRDQDRRMSMVQAGGRRVAGGQVRDDSQQFLAPPAPEFGGVAASPGVRMPTYERPAQNDRTFEMRDEKGFPVSYEMPSYDERLGQARQNADFEMRRKLDYEFTKGEGLAAIDIRKQRAAQDINSVSAGDMKDMYEGNLDPSRKLNPDLLKSFGTAANLRQTAAIHTDNVEQKKLDRTSREGIAEKGRANAAGIASKREAGANSRHAAEKPPAAPKLDERQKNKLQVIRELDTQISRLNHELTKRDDRFPDHAIRQKALRDDLLKQKRREEAALEADRQDVEGQMARRYNGIP